MGFDATLINDDVVTELKLIAGDPTEEEEAGKLNAKSFYFSSHTLCNIYRNCYFVIIE